MIVYMVIEQPAKKLTQKLVLEKNISYITFHDYLNNYLNVVKINLFRNNIK